MSDAQITPRINECTTCWNTLSTDRQGRTFCTNRQCQAFGVILHRCPATRWNGSGVRCLLTAGHGGSHLVMTDNTTIAWNTAQAQSIEQAARDMLTRMGVGGAEYFTSGDLVELAELIARDRRAH